MDLAYEDAKDEIISFLLKGPEKSYSRMDETSKCLIFAGPWGIGKTHLIKKDVFENPSVEKRFRKRKIIYSLSGKDSAEAIDSDLSGLIHPFIGTLAKLSTRVSASLSGGAASVNVDLGIRSKLKSFETFIFQRKRPFLLVLDDLERLDPAVSIQSIFGIVDAVQSVCHKDSRIVIICNDEKILGDEAKSFVYVSFRDKVARKYIRITKASETAAKSIVGQASELLDEEKYPFETNLLGNLRVVAHLSDAWERIFANMEIDQEKKKYLFNLLACLVYENETKGLPSIPEPDPEKKKAEAGFIWNYKRLDEDEIEKIRKEYGDEPTLAKTVFYYEANSLDIDSGRTAEAVFKCFSEMKSKGFDPDSFSLPSSSDYITTRKVALLKSDISNIFFRSDSGKKDLLTTVSSKLNGLTIENHCANDAFNIVCLLNVFNASYELGGDYWEFLEWMKNQYKSNRQLTWNTVFLAPSLSLSPKPLDKTVSEKLSVFANECHLLGKMNIAKNALIAKNLIGVEVLIDEDVIGDWLLENIPFSKKTFSGELDDADWGLAMEFVDSFYSAAPGEKEKLVGTLKRMDDKSSESLSERIRFLILRALPPDSAI